MRKLRWKVRRLRENKTNVNCALDKYNIAWQEGLIVERILG